MKNHHPLALWAGPLFAQAAPPAADDEAKLRGELQVLSQEFQKCRKDHAAACAQFPDDFALTQLKVEKCALLSGRYLPGLGRDEAFRRSAAEARAVMAALAAGRRAELPATGLVERAYLSEIDRSAQPYFVYVPEKLKDAPGKAPLLLFLHGYVGNLDKVSWLDITMPDSAKTCADRLGAVLLAPFARGNTDFQGIGERDVLRAIELTCRDYKVDPDRVWLAGCSMGASGVWTIAAHYPHLFAAAVPASGRTDYNLWQNVPRGTLAEYKQLAVDRDFAVTLAPNFRNLPVFAFHGEDDWLVQPEQSRAMVKTLQGKGFEAILHVFPRGDHWMCFGAFESELVFGWLPTKRLGRRPVRVSYRTWHPRLNRAYWAAIDDFIEYGRPAEIDVRVESPLVIAIKTENVARLTLDLWPEFFVVKQVQARLPDGTLIKPVAVKGNSVTFARAPMPEGGLRKRGELSGPIYEAYQQPFLIVHGAIEGPEATPRMREAAGMAVVEWFEFAAGIARTKKDTDVTDEDIRTCNLVLLGSPATNKVLARIAARLPVTIGEGKYTVGKRTFEGENLGLGLVYPNPENPERLVVVWSGVPWGRALPSNHKYDLLPDFIVFDDTPSPVNGTNNYRVAGYFDINWKLDEKLTWLGPEKAPPKPELPDTPPLPPLEPTR